MAFGVAIRPGLVCFWRQGRSPRGLQRPLMCLNSSSLPCTVLSRRSVLAAMFFSSLLPVRAFGAEKLPSLPPGARQFNNVRAAEMQWTQIGVVLNREVSSGEWSNLRGYLRTFFKIGEDLEFLSSNFSDSSKKRVKDIVKLIRRNVKEMDKFAAKENQMEFLHLHGDVSLLLAEFFVLLKEAAVADIPEDL